MRFLISACLPAPSTIVVSFLSTVIFLARPRCSSSTLSSFRPRSSLISVPPVSDGDVAQHGLAAIAEARGLHRTDIEHAAQLVDDQGRQRFAFDIFGDDQQRLAASGATFSSIGTSSREVADFLFVNQNQRVFQHAIHFASAR